MFHRYAWFALFLPLLFTVVGCGDKPKPKTEDPAQIEQIRQKAEENAKREQSSSK